MDIKLEGLFSLSWKNLKTGKSGRVESRNTIVHTGSDAIINALLKEGFSFGSGTDGAGFPRTIDYVDSSNVKNHVDEIRIGTGSTAPAVSQTDLVTYPTTESVSSPNTNHIKPLYNGTAVNTGVAITPNNTVGRGFKLVVTWASGDANPVAGQPAVEYREAGLFMGNILFARTTFPVTGKDSSTVMTSTWNIRWR